jgi:hypothetical protein
MLVQDLHIRIINAATGELLRELTLDPGRIDQPTGTPRPAARATPQTIMTPNPPVGSGHSYVLRDHIGAGEGNRTLMTSLEVRGSRSAMSRPDILAGLCCRITVSSRG